MDIIESHEIFKEYLFDKGTRLVPHGHANVNSIILGEEPFKLQSENEGSLGEYHIMIMDQATDQNNAIKYLLGNLLSKKNISKAT